MMDDADTAWDGGEAVNQGKRERKPAGPAGAMTVEEAADYLCISRSGLYRLFRTGALPKATILSRTVVRRIDLDAFLARCVEPAARQSNAGAA